MVQKSASREMDKFIVRLPDGMRERLATRAKVNERSMNSEIVAILDEALGRPDNERYQSLKAEQARVEATKHALLAQLAELEGKEGALVHQIGDLARHLSIRFMGPKNGPDEGVQPTHWGKPPPSGEKP